MLFFASSQLKSGRTRFVFKSYFFAGRGLSVVPLLDFRKKRKNKRKAIKNMDYRKSDYANNKCSSSIIYNSSVGRCEIDAAQTDDPAAYKKKNDRNCNNEKRDNKSSDCGNKRGFDFWKSWSDENYRETDRADTVARKHSRSLESVYTENSELLSLTDEYFKRDIHNETVELARRALSTLTPLQRRRYILYNAYDLTYREIAEREGVDAMAVYRSVEKAKNSVKKFIEGVYKSRF